MNTRKKFVRLALAVAACSTMAFTLPGCPDTEALNAQIAALEKKAADNARQMKEMSDKLVILNDEHNAVKSLVSQISSTVLEQKDALEKLDASVREAGSRRSAPAAAAPAKKAAAKKRR